MTAVDWAVLVAYIGGMVVLSLHLSRGQQNAEDYFVGGRDLPWWAVAISTMATQTSVNSFVGIPAFVALAAGGGLVWLQFELAVPLAMIMASALFHPPFRELSLVSVYGYLERRFDAPTRRFASAVFLVNRGLQTGVMVFASAVVVSVCLSLPVWLCVLIVAVVTVIYDSLGGMKAVVWSDVIQMGVLLFGLIACIGLAFSEVGGVSAALAHVPTERLVASGSGTGLGDGAQAPLWGFLVSGLFLYVSYYGTDQTQVQRALSAPSPDDTRRALVFNGLARFPLTLLYLALGLGLCAVYANSDSLRAAVGDGQLDALVPHFVISRLPVGVRGIVMAAVLAAAMSSLDSALNSLSASTMKDFVEPALQRRGSALRPEAALKWSKVVTVSWGVLITIFALMVGDISDTVVEGINKVGSVFYGPILAAFASGVLDRRARGPAVIAGTLAGVGVNLVLWLAMGDVFWMWWNVSGLVVGAGLTAIVSRFMTPPAEGSLEGTTLTWDKIRGRERRHGRSHLQLLLYFLVILAFVAFSDDLLALFL